MNKKYKMISHKDKPTPEENAFLNACDCLFYGYGRAHWQTCGIIDKQTLDKIWTDAVNSMTEF